MTTFGKIVMSLFVVATLTGIYYGTKTYVKEDNAVLEEKKPAPDSQAVEPSASSTEESASSTGGAKKQESFTSILQQGGKQKCSISQPLGQMISTGVVYINNALVRAEFSVSVMDKTINTTMIARDGYMYSWTSGNGAAGTKTKMPTSDSLKQGTSTVRTWNGDLVKDYSCEAWSPDAKLFEIPSTVTFKEVI
jgi:hypothetical protein